MERNTIHPYVYNYIYIEREREYSYSKYCNLIGQLQGTIFRSTLIQGTILIVPACFDNARALWRQHAYCAIQLIIIRLDTYYVTMSSHGHS